MSLSLLLAFSTYGFLATITFPVEIQAKLYRPGEPTTIYTPGSDEWHTSWYYVSDRADFVFSVKGCSHAYLALTEYPGNISSQSVEIRLGVHDNQGAQLALAQSGALLFDSSTPDILHCDEYRTFWLRWVTNYIEVGRGNMVGYQKLLNFQQPTTIYYAGIGLRSGHRNALLWRINENSGRKLRVVTPDNYYYNTMWKSVQGRNFINFAVRACSDAHVVLTENEGDTSGKVYEFIIGGWTNSKSLLRLSITTGDASYVKAEDLGSKLDCQSYRHFHVTWHQGNLEAGHGDVVRGSEEFATTTFLQWTDPSPIDVRYFGISTGSGYNGTWIFDDDIEAKTYVVTRNNQNNPMSQRYNTTLIESPRKQFFTFEVEACSEANILLSQQESLENDLEVAIGTSYNSKTAIRYLTSGSYLVSATTQDILKCNELREFWISWANGVIRVGHGATYGYRDILPQFTIPTGFKVNAISLTTISNTGLWKFREDMGSRVKFSMPVDYTHSQTVWRTTMQRSYQVFRVKACQDAHISLLPLIGVQSVDYYYLISLGGWANTQSQIHRIIGGVWEPIGTLYSTPALLKCDSYIDLWASWSKRYIQAGTGPIPGQSMFMNTELPDELTVMSYSISNGFEATGDWIIDEDIGDYLVFVTNTTRNDGNVLPYWLAVDIYMTSAVFRVDTCADAHVFVVDSAGSISGKHFEFHLGAIDGAWCYIKDQTGVIMASKEAESGKRWTTCGVSAHYWIGWDQGRFQLGEGVLPGVNLIIEYNFGQTMNVGGITMSSDSPNQAIWRWQDTTAFWTVFDTPITFGYQYVWKTATHRMSIAFDVVACSDVHIALTTHPVQSPPFSGYEIVIGGWTNSRSIIRDGGWGGYVYAQYDKTGLLDCSVRRNFWISWAGDAIRVGLGSAIGQSQIMQYLPITMKSIRAVGFSTGYDHHGQYTINLWDYYLSTPQPAYEVPYPAAEDGSSGSSVSTLSIVLIVVSCVCIVSIVLIIVAIVTNFGKKSSSLNIPFPLQRYNSKADEVTIVTSELPPAQDLPSPDSAYGSPRIMTLPPDFPTLP